jgi:hypothetical protein
MPMNDRSSNPFWPKVPPVRRRWPRVFLIAAVVAGLVAVLFASVLNG